MSSSLSSSVAVKTNEPITLSDNQSIHRLLTDAIDKYKAYTGIDLRDTDNDLARRLIKASSEHDTMEILQETSRAFDDFRAGNPRWEKFRKAVKPVVRAVLLFNDVAAEAATSAYAPGGKSVLVAIGVLLRATQDVSAHFDALSELFEELNHCLGRLGMRKDIPLGDQSRDIAVNILVELLNVLALATKMMQDSRWRARFRSFRKALFAEESQASQALNRLKGLVDKELRVAVIENLVATHQVLSMQSDHARTVDGLVRLAVGRDTQMAVAIRELASTVQKSVLSSRTALPTVHNHSTNQEVSSPSFTNPTDLAYQNFTQVIVAASQGDPLAFIFFLMLFAASSLSFARQPNAQTAAIPLVLLGLWRALSQMQRSIAPTIDHNSCNTITLIDLLGARIPLATQMCQSPEVLHDYLVLLFKEKKGAWFVHNHQYELTKPGDGQSIGFDQWISAVVSGAEIVMNAILSKRGAEKAAACPSCNTLIGGHGVQPGLWVTCAVCNTEFKVSTAESLQPEVASEGDRHSNSRSVHERSHLFSSRMVLDDPVQLPLRWRSTGFASRTALAPLDDLRYVRRIRMVYDPTSVHPESAKPSDQQEWNADRLVDLMSNAFSLDDLVTASGKMLSRVMAAGSKAVKEQSQGG
ncbi:hypothetical protein K488DRAFT_68723 [Vararia minispora EC-137]|uniref:Uncharacterized protein n=1 Tax=Vararia minispora EC-137 TaxID=1314806 RepID=A0ACB8QUF1_9AGAM|nr:hypothetical protein K488DRAFT_68723 [Vararia minispora EC-137]